MLFRGFLFGGPTGQERLDQPLSNFDIIGIPTGTWSTHLFACWENIVPSCVVSFCCPCIMWAQIAIRAQIPLFIGIKNSCAWGRSRTGYGIFVDVFFWTLAISLMCIIVAATVSAVSYSLRYLLYVIGIALLCGFAFVIGHTRTAFRDKYQLPGLFPRGAEFWDMMYDIFLSVTCIPCVLAQMGRHVFQYDRMNPKLGLFLGDPSSIPPLPPLPGETGTADRPVRADQAGLTWANDSRHPNARDNRGAAHRQEEILQQQRQGMLSSGSGSNSPVVATAAPVGSAPYAPVYKQDGSRV